MKCYYYHRFPFNISTEYGELDILIPKNEDIIEEYEDAHLEEHGIYIEESERLFEGAYVIFEVSLLFPYEEVKYLIEKYVEFHQAKGGGYISDFIYMIKSENDLF
jgi:hypothetical protein